MNNTITVTGLVATDPRYATNSTEATISFRFATVPTDIDTPNNWYTVIATGALARNLSQSVHKGDRIIVTGDLRIRDWDNGQTSGTSVEIVTKALGHDLNYGVSKFTRGTYTPDSTTEEHTCTCEYHNA
jgi:single-strand DNA-binding protein